MKSSQRVALFKVMNNLFSIFDPSSLGHFSLHWLSLLGVLVLSPSKF